MTYNKTSLFLLLLFSCLLVAEKYSVELRDAPAVDALRLVASIEQENVVMPEGVEGNITARFSDIEIGHAIDSLLASKNLAVIKEHGVNRVVSKKTVEDSGTDLATTTFNLKHGKAADLKTQITPLLSLRGSAMVDERTNSLSIRDVANNLENVANLIKNIDKADRQILIEARIVEASTDFSRGLGVEWGLGFSSSSVDLSRPTPAIQRALAVGVRPGAGVSLDVALSAGERDGKANIISRPSIVTMNNQPATISSGLKFFIKVPGGVSIGTGAATGSTGAASAADSSAGSAPASSGGSIREISSGISMIVTPQITADDKISLAVNVAESQPDFGKVVDGVPAINDNSATTTVSLKDGETTVIGGLFTSQDSENGEGLPFFRSIPILGPLLFGRQEKSKNKKELLIFIKPSIVKNSETADQILEHREIIKPEQAVRVEAAKGP